MKMYLYSILQFKLFIKRLFFVKNLIFVEYFLLIESVFELRDVAWCVTAVIAGEGLLRIKIPAFSPHIENESLILFLWLATPEVANFIRGKKLDANLLQRLKNTLYAVEAVLNDAELKQINDSAVNKWLDDLKDAVYVADDLLDRLSTKAATQKEARANDGSKLASCVPKAPVIRYLEIVRSSKVVLQEVPHSVEDLSIEGRQVESLLSLKYGQSLTAVNCICFVIGNWDNLECFSLEGGMPPSLRSLNIENCEKLLRSPSLATMDMLTYLCIAGPYDGVKSFPEEGLVLLPPSLTHLLMWR
ncbi:hypothetical protein RJT34_23962 [Clitoria ternatea]|uniref:Disease resistance N-terminal domain-containing protein n=1 Tax=Clitoria ternatea TaxID=43366 RepID=A0AAN9FTL3_CLITE